MKLHHISRKRHKTRLLKCHFNHFNGRTTTNYEKLVKRESDSPTEYSVQISGREVQLAKADILKSGRMHSLCEMNYNYNLV